MNNEKIKYFIYARKSSEGEDRQVQSIDDQIEELKKLAKNGGLEVVEILSEAKSAKAPGRPVFDEMLARISRGEANGILCWKLNRLARNPIDGGNISWMLQEGLIQHIQTYGRGYSPSDNVIMMSVEFGMANQFIRDLRVDTKRGLKAKAERGWYPTFATLGYIHNPFKIKGEKEIIKDTERWDLVRRMFDLMLSGQHTPPKIIEIASNEWGLRNKKGGVVARSTIYRIFSDPFYYGEFEYPKNSGNWYQGLHEPMITRDEYEKIQVMLGKKGRPRPKKYDFAFRGPLMCGECGASVTAENKVKKQKNGNVHMYTYYHCTKRKDPNCSQRSIEEKKLEKQIMEKLKGIEIPKEFHEWAMDVLKNANSTEVTGRKQAILNQRREYDSILKKLDGLIDMRANNEIGEEDFKRRKSSLTQEKERLNKLINETDQRVDEWLDIAERYFEFAEHARESFQDGDLNTKKTILTTLGSNLSIKDGELNISLAELLIPIEKSAEEVRRIHSMFEPLKGVENKRTLGEMYSQSPILLRE